ncbi:MAG: hypothetical protein WD991_01700 [Candidatus Paceibacterota bacterium]
MTGTGCGQWTVTTNDPGRLDLTSATSGTGAGSVNGVVGANGGAKRDLKATLTWSGGSLTITITQAARP